MKKKLSALLTAIFLLCSLLLSGCSKATPLPEGMEEEAVGKAAREVVALLVAGEYQSVADLFRPDMQQTYSVTAQTIEDLMAIVSNAGAFVKAEETLVLGGENKNFSEPYAAVAVYCEHEEKNIVYEMSFDLDMALIGLAAKKK